jgi:glucose-6-phosphate 1-dehydrogenase
LLFGATGDLTGRYLLPALAALHAHERLPDGFELLGAATSDWDDAAFRGFASEQLERHAPDVDQASREAVVGMLRYRPVDVADAGSVAALVGDTGEPLAAYLALPQGLFGTTAANLARAGLPDGSRVALEKPFGEDRHSARELNELLHRVLGDGAEQIIFRVDHVLGMGTLQNLIAMRRSGRVLESAWNGEHVEEVEVLWEETLALEGRATFYDRAGALKDVMQNHMMQLLAVVAMEPLAQPSADAFRDAKLQALCAVRSLEPGEVDRLSQRARYAAGGDIPAYVEEDGVDAARGTETFAEVLLELDSPRWAGTRFRLRAGKALAHKRKGVVVHFRDGDELWIGIDGPEDIALRLAPLTLSSEPYRSELPAYAEVLLDLLGGGSSLSVRDDEVEEAWRIVDPVVAAWHDDRVPMRDYAAGSNGPPRL